MRKILLIPALLVSSMALATDYNYEITPVIGYDYAEGNLNLKDYMLGGIELQYNGYDSVIKPEFSILYSNGVDSEQLTPSSSTNVYRFNLNGVYEFSDMQYIQPFVKAGIGYEKMSTRIAANDSDHYCSAGTGVKIKLTDSIALKAEALYTLKYNNNNNNAHSNMGDSNLAILAGLNFSFGPKAQNAPEPTPQPVVEPEPTPEPTPAPKPAPTPVVMDDDNDGVANAEDICPNTPANELVNVDGCPKIITLSVQFDNDSSLIKPASYDIIEKYADFLNKYSAYSSKIVGHTDSKGSDAYNLSLSKKRAAAVVNMLIGKGVPSDRLSSNGEGEANPKADNSTKDGRAQNRRIEATLTRD